MEGKKYCVCIAGVPVNAQSEARNSNDSAPSFNGPLTPVDAREQQKLSWPPQHLSGSIPCRACHVHFDVSMLPRWFVSLELAGGSSLRARTRAAGGAL